MGASNSRLNGKYKNFSDENFFVNKTQGTKFSSKYRIFTTESFAKKNNFTTKYQSVTTRFTKLDYYTSLSAGVFVGLAVLLMIFVCVLFYKKRNSTKNIQFKPSLDDDCSSKCNNKKELVFYKFLPL